MKNVEKARSEFALIVLIADRFEHMAFNRGPMGFVSDRTTLLMDLDFAHKHVPLDLERLLKAPDMDFSHDVFGIRRHMNRETCKLEGCFMPRYARREAAAVAS